MSVWSRGTLDQNEFLWCVVRTVSEKSAVIETREAQYCINCIKFSSVSPVASRMKKAAERSPNPGSFLTSTQLTNRSWRVGCECLIVGFRKWSDTDFFNLTLEKVCRRSFRSYSVLLPIGYLLEKFLHCWLNISLLLSFSHQGCVLLTSVKNILKYWLWRV